MNKKSFIVLLLAAFMVLTLAACGKQNKDDVVITFHYSNSVGEQKYTNDVEAKMNEIMHAIEGYEHISIDLVPHSGQYATEFALAQTNKEQIDIFNSFWLDFDKLVADGDVLALDDLVEAYPGVASDIPAWLLDYGKYNGTQYYIPTYQQAMSPSFFYAPEEFFNYYYKASGDDRDDVVRILQKGSIEDKLDFFEEFYLAVVKGTGDATRKMAVMSMPFHYYNLDDIEASNGKIFLPEGEDEPLYWPMTKEFKTITKRYNEWFKKGYINTPDVKNSYVFNEKGTVVFGIGTNAQSEKAYAEARSTSAYKCDAIRMTDHHYIQSKWAAGGNAIYSDCEHPEEAMMVIELLMSEKGKEFYNTLIWGLEGIHYEWVDKDAGRIKTLEFDGPQGGAETTYCAWNWNTGNIFNGWMNQSMASDDHYKFIEEEIHAGKTTVVSPLMGITWDLSGMSDKIGQLAAVNSEYYSVLYAAEDFNASYDAYMKKLKTAGVEDVMKDITKQMNDFLGK